MKSKIYNNKEELYNDYMQQLRKKILAKYNELGLRASGNFEKELKVDVNANQISIRAAKYAYQMEYGRKRGKFPPVKEIEKWIETKKGLPTQWQNKKTSIAWAIATNIAKKGIKVPNKYNKGMVVSTIVDEFLAKDLRKMLDDLGYIYLRQMEKDVINIFRK